MSKYVPREGVWAEPWARSRHREAALFTESKVLSKSQPKWTYLPIYTDFVAYSELFCLHKARSHSQIYCFCKTKDWQKEWSQWLYATSVLEPYQSTPRPMVPGPWKCTVLEHDTELTLVKQYTLCVSNTLGRMTFSLPTLHNAMTPGQSKHGNKLLFFLPLTKLERSF